VPQRHHQLAGQCDDGNALGSSACIGGAGAEPAAELAVGLMSQPEPGELDRVDAGARAACLAGALLAPLCQGLGVNPT